MKRANTNYEAAARMLAFEGADEKTTDHGRYLWVLSGIGHALLAIADAITSKQVGE